VWYFAAQKKGLDLRKLVAMKKITLLSIIAVGLLFSSCKKKETTTTSGGGGGSASGYTNVYGTMTAAKSLNYNQFTHLPDTSYSASAWYFNTPQNNWMFTNFSLGSTTSCGGVYVDSVKLAALAAPGIYIYIDSTYTLKLATKLNWNVLGSGTVPAINYSPTIPWPSYTGYASLPDSIHKSGDTFIALSGITAGDSVSAGINDGSNASGHSYTSRMVSASATGITIKSMNTVGFNNTVNGYLTVNIYKFSPAVSISGKNFVFIKQTTFQKIVEIDNF
jgi:hypothetical protein